MTEHWKAMIPTNASSPEEREVFLRAKDERVQDEEMSRLHPLRLRGSSSSCASFTAMARTSLCSSRRDDHIDVRDFNNIFSNG